MIASIGAFIAYILHLSVMSTKMWGYQQSWILCLVMFLPLFDDPLSLAKLLPMFDPVIKSEGELHAALFVARCITAASLTMVTIYVGLLMVYFLCVFEEMGSGRLLQLRIKANDAFLRLNDELSTRIFSNLFKVILVGSFWIIFIATYLRIRHEREVDPSLSLFDGSMHHAPAVRAMIGLFVVYCLWLFFTIVDAIRALLDLSTPFLLIAAATLVTIGFVLAGPFVGVYYSVPENAANFFWVYTTIHLYVYLLAFAYTPIHTKVSQDDDDESGAFRLDSRHFTDDRSTLEAFKDYAIEEPADDLQGNENDDEIELI